MRFQLKSALIATAVASVVFAVGMQLFHALEGSAKTRALIAVSAMVVGVAIGCLRVCTQEKRMHQRLRSEPTLLLSDKRLVRRLSRFLRPTLLLAALAYISAIFIAYDPNQVGSVNFDVFQVAFLLFTAFFSVRLVMSLHALRDNLRGQTYRFNTNGFVQRHHFVSWDRVAGFEYEAASQVAFIEFGLLGCQRLGCDQEDADCIRELYKLSKQTTSLKR